MGLQGCGLCIPEALFVLRSCHSSARLDVRFGHLHQQLLRWKRTDRMKMLIRLPSLTGRTALGSVRLLTRAQRLPRSPQSERKNGSDLKGKAPTGLSLDAGGSTGCCQAKFPSTRRGCLRHKAINCCCGCNGANWDALLP